MMQQIHVARVSCGFVQIWSLHGRGVNPPLALGDGSGTVTLCSSELHHASYLVGLWVLLTCYTKQNDLNAFGGFYIEVFKIFQKIGFF